MTSQRVEDLEHKTLTIKGKTDGFGAQYNAILSGFAFCDNREDFTYIHTPFYSISHGWGWVNATEPESSWKKRTDVLNEFIGIPDGRSSMNGKRVDIRIRKGVGSVFRDKRPSNWYTESTRQKIRDHYWSTSKPPSCEQDIVVHIRRGDVQPERRDRNSRWTGNEWYRDRIPWVASKYPDNYTIAVHSEGEMSEFESIMDGWPDDLRDRTTWKLGKNWEVDVEHDLMTAFHEMVTAKVLLQSRSSFAFVPGILSKGDVWHMPSKRDGASMGIWNPLDDWHIIQHSRSKLPDGMKYGELCKLIEDYRASQNKK
tara:strand:- start:2682 stop:3617 length:936 start_codon:yes stop_codon:yes gene_type:complete